MTTFFERISETKPVSREDISVLRGSVIRHLNKLLNTRQGSAPIHSDYGLPDLSEFIYSFPESISEMENLLAATIEKFEPRLESVRVSYKEDPDDVLNIKFEISAQLVGSDPNQQDSCWFETTVGATGHIKIEA